MEQKNNMNLKIVFGGILCVLVIGGYVMLSKIDKEQPQGTEVSGVNKDALSESQQRSNIQVSDTQSGQSATPESAVQQKAVLDSHLQDLKKQFESALITGGSKLIPYAISDSLSAGGVYATVLDFGKEKTENYFVQITSDGKERSGLIGYQILVGLGNRVESGGGKITLLNVHCGNGIEAVISSQDLCKEGAVEGGNVNIDKLHAGVGLVKISVKGKGKITADIFVTFVAKDPARQNPYVVLFKNIAFEVGN